MVPCAIHFVVVTYGGNDDGDASDYLSKVATTSDCPHAAPLFYSLMNTVLSFDPVGWGLPMGG